MRAASESSMVTGSLSVKLDSTGWPVRMELRKSPWSNELTYDVYWLTRESLKP